MARAFFPELDIVVWALHAESVRLASERTQRIFTEAAKRDLHLALARLPVGLFPTLAANLSDRQESVLCLRSVLMKPEHRDWLDEILSILDAAFRNAE